MKHLISPIANGGAPIYLDDLINGDLQNKQAYEAILAGLGDKIVISGCEVTNIDGGAGTCDIAAGFVYLNSTVMEVPNPYSGTYPIYIHEATAVNDTRDFEDGNTDIVATTRVAEFTGTPSVDNIEISPTSGYYLDTCLKLASNSTDDIRLVTNLTNVGAKFDGTGLGLDTNIERGFALCNGANGTPDLIGKFIVGYGGFADYTTMEATGGEATHTLTEAEMPSHTHTLSNDEASLYYTASGTGWGGAGAGSTATPTVDSTGGDQPHENRPPYYVLAYVMKVS